VDVAKAFLHLITLSDIMHAGFNSQGFVPPAENDKRLLDFGMHALGSAPPGSQNTTEEILRNRWNDALGVTDSQFFVCSKCAMRRSAAERFEFLGVHFHICSACYESGKRDVMERRHNHA
jgi:hypothetical protein